MIKFISKIFEIIFYIPKLIISTIGKIFKTIFFVIGQFFRGVGFVLLWLMGTFLVAILSVPSSMILFAFFDIGNTVSVTVGLLIAAKFGFDIAKSDFGKEDNITQQEQVPVSLATISQMFKGVGQSYNQRQREKEIESNENAEKILKNMGLK